MFRDAGAKLEDGHGPSNGILANQMLAVEKSLSNSSSSSSSDKAIDAVNHVIEVRLLILDFNLFYFQ